ncbi:hypothetical protein [Desulforhopalus singaporensis]|uniref:Uncharacterized protein n=1 Tax=Desulforhopalus singaporensis TaxID=91360 RepID=A0A1H0VJF6_9BACT|nr:hypothetical protein [Desulforhopalus singaporensis]SDP78580.1 hypothetical protein SAMN05660330_04103 [Desulforhopalus singaporensis]
MKKKIMAGALTVGMSVCLASAASANLESTISAINSSITETTTNIASGVTTSTVSKITEGVMDNVGVFTYNAAYNASDLDSSVDIEGATSFGFDGDISEFAATSVATEISLDAQLTYGDILNKIETTGIGAYSSAVGPVDADGNSTEAGLVINEDILRDINSTAYLTTFCGTELCSSPALDYSDTGVLGGSPIDDANFQDIVGFNLAMNEGAIDSSVAIKAYGEVVQTVDEGAPSTITDYDGEAITSVISVADGASYASYFNNDLNNLQIATTAIGAYGAGSINVGVNIQELVDL